MCMRGLGDGIRVLTTYGPSFLSSIPAVSTGTMGSLLQTGKLMNKLGVKSFYSPLPFITCFGPNLSYCVHTWKYLSSTCCQNDIFYSVLTCLPTSKSSLELHFKLNGTIPPPIPPLLTWQTRPESNPRAVLRGWFGGQHGLKSHTGKKCLNFCRKQRCRQKAPSSAVIEVNLHDLWGSINSLW